MKRGPWPQLQRQPWVLAPERGPGLSSDFSLKGPEHRRPAGAAVQSAPRPLARGSPQTRSDKQMITDVRQRKAGLGRRVGSASMCGHSTTEARDVYL